MNIYVGNISKQATEDQLRQLFETHGGIKSVKIITDRMTGEPRGFGFVEMLNRDEAQQAVTSLNGSELNGQKLVVNESRPKPDNRDRNNNRQGGGNRFGGGRSYR